MTELRGTGHSPSEREQRHTAQHDDGAAQPRDGMRPLEQQPPATPTNTTLISRADATIDTGASCLANNTKMYDSVESTAASTVFAPALSRMGLSARAVTALASHSVYDAIANNTDRSGPVPRASGYTIDTSPARYPACSVRKYPVCSAPLTTTAPASTGHDGGTFDDEIPGRMRKSGRDDQQEDDQPDVDQPDDDQPGEIAAT